MVWSYRDGVLPTAAASYFGRVQGESPRHDALYRPRLSIIYWSLFACALSEADPQASSSHLLSTKATFAFSKSWEVLGPFQIGTREAIWGADPLEYLGGFRALEYDEEAVYHSSLTANGTTKWNIIAAGQTFSTTSSANASLSVSYINVDWDFLKNVYGWAATQYQVWARGNLTVNGNQTRTALLHTDAILEFLIDGVHYFGGDFYSFRKAPVVLHLAPGTHRFDLRLIRDVRAFGGDLPPSIDVSVHVELVSNELQVSNSGARLSDLVDGRFASSIASVTLTNSGKESIEVISIHAVRTKPARTWNQAYLQKMIPDFIADSSTDVHEELEMLDTRSLGTLLAAGQTRPISFLHPSSPISHHSLHLIIRYKTVHSTDTLMLHLTQSLVHASIYEPHKVTFLHPSGTVSYAMLRAPAKNASCKYMDGTKLPVLLGLHGAGLNADNGIVAHALDPVPDLCAWVLFPTGSTPWSGDDWHAWGLADVEAAIQSIPDWIQRVGWKGPDADIDRWIVTGHSNGGQGTWYALTHRPDKIVAAAPVSGYSSIQKYVPYELWQPADPRRTAVLSASLNSYRHEMLMSNARGIPIQQQHGELDDNVPAYHSRFLAQQIQLSAGNSSYNEVAGRPHYWENVMTTPQLVDFYHAQANSYDAIPRALEEFDIVVGDPAGMGPKNGIRVLQLDDPGQYGRVSVKGHTIKTSNVLALDFDPHIFTYREISIDGGEIMLSAASPEDAPLARVKMSKQGEHWRQTVAAVLDPTRSFSRQGRQLGSISAILRSQGHFIIRHKPSRLLSHIALQVSRNLHQYFSANAQIVVSSAWTGTANGTGNVITVGTNSSLAPSVHPDFPLSVRGSTLVIRDSVGARHNYGGDGGDDSAIGAAFLRPLDGERLELVLWGNSDSGLDMATRMVPTLTGAGQPDFVILGDLARWKGVDGALAMGFFDSTWNVTRSSILS